MDCLSNYRTVPGADGYLKARHTDLSTAASDLEERGLQGKTSKTEMPALPDVDPSSRSYSQIIGEIEPVQNALDKAIFSMEQAICRHGNRGGTSSLIGLTAESDL